MAFYLQERLGSMEHSMSVMGKSPPSPGGAAPEVFEAKKAAGNRRRTTSNSRHRYTSYIQKKLLVFNKVQ